MFRIAFGIAYYACRGFQHAPCPIFMAYTVFKRFAHSGAARLFSRLRYFLAIFRGDLLKRGGLLQLLQRIAEDFLIGKTIEDASALPVYDGDHVRRSLMSEAAQL